MKIEEVKERLEKIQQCQYDNEEAHIEEDSLIYDFVEAVTEGKYKTREEMIEVAKEVIKVSDIEFDRWYA